MSGEGQPQAVGLDARGLSVGIVGSLWHADLNGRLIERAERAAADSGATSVTYKVAGAIELPVVAQALARRHDAVVALGVVIRGGTPHFEYVCQSVTEGLTRVALDEGTPVGNGVLTTDTEAQAWARSGGPDSSEDKGYAACIAALGAALTLREIAGSGR